MSDPDQPKATPGTGRNQTDARTQIMSSIDWYNHHRRHTRLDNLSPTRYEQHHQPAAHATQPPGVNQNGSVPLHRVRSHSPHLNKVAVSFRGNLSSSSCSTDKSHTGYQERFYFLYEPILVNVTQHCQYISLP